MTFVIKKDTVKKKVFEKFLKCFCGGGDYKLEKIKKFYNNYFISREFIF
jgi:hypothetical protein